MENKYFEEVVALLLLKSADTNKFLKSDANKALDVMSEQVSIHKAVTSVISGGLESKNCQIRTTVARLLANITTAVGCQNVFESSPDTYQPLLLAAAELLVDGSVEVRTFTKTLFRTLGKHQQFYTHLQQVIGEQAKFNRLEKIIKDL